MNKLEAKNLVSPAFIIEVMRPSIRTLVSGTSIIKYYSYSVLWYVLVCYAILLDLSGIVHARSLTGKNAQYRPSPPVIWFNDRMIVDTVDITPQG